MCIFYLSLGAADTVVRRSSEMAFLSASFHWVSYLYCLIASTSTAPWPGRQRVILFLVHSWDMLLYSMIRMADEQDERMSDGSRLIRTSSTEWIWQPSSPLYVFDCLSLDCIFAVFSGISDEYDRHLRVVSHVSGVQLMPTLIYHHSLHPSECITVYSIPSTSLPRPIGHPSTYSKHIFKARNYSSVAQACPWSALKAAKSGVSPNTLVHSSAACFSCF